MSSEEKQEATEDYIAEYEVERDDRTTRVNNVNFSAFHDVKRSLRTLQDMVCLMLLKLVQTIFSFIL